jgi:hypothetical protein
VEVLSCSKRGPGIVVIPGFQRCSEDASPSLTRNGGGALVCLANPLLSLGPWHGGLRQLKAYFDCTKAVLQAQLIACSLQSSPQDIVTKGYGYCYGLNGQLVCHHTVRLHRIKSVPGFEIDRMPTGAATTRQIERFIMRGLFFVLTCA